MTERFGLSRVFNDPSTAGIDRVLASTVFVDAPDRPATVLSLADRRAPIAPFAADLVGSAASPSPPV